MRDPTGPELLDALERLIVELKHSPCLEEIVERALVAVPGNATDQLRSLLRTPEETAVLRAAVFVMQTKNDRYLWQSMARLGRLVAAIPPERRAELMKEDKTDA
jgi:hypothetical protein